MTPTAMTVTNDAVRLAYRETCAVPPCTIGVAAAMPHTKKKSIAVEIDGTATVQARCTVGNASGLVGSELTATGILPVTAICDTVQLEVTACTGCTVTGYIRGGDKHKSRWW
jgi:hypothetical protein